MIQKRKLFFWLMPLAVLASCYGITREKLKSMEPVGVKIENGVSIVELFTSEGCSSCPPADILLSKIAAENKHVYVLSYHVDYWDHLGWKDPFSQKVFTDRQRQYAKRFNLESIYTPQVVVNGAEEFVGSDEPRLRSSLSRYNTLTSFELNAVRKNAATINISYELKSSAPFKLNIALVQPNASNEIKRGENSGRTLQHVNVVRQLNTISPQSEVGSIEVGIPATLQDKDFELFLFTQHQKNNRITAASKMIIPRFNEMKNK